MRSLLVLSFLAVACGTQVGGAGGPGGPGTSGPRALTEAEASTTGRTQVANVMQHAETVLKFADGAMLLSDFLGRPAQAPTVCDPMDLGCVDNANAKDIDVHFDGAIKDVDKFLTERVFVSTQLEAGATDAVVYHLQPATFCQSTNPKDDCVQFLTQVPVRLRLTSTAVGSLDAAVLIMDAKVEVARATLSDKQVTATLLLSAGPSTQAGCTGHPMGCIGKAVQAGLEAFGSHSDAQNFELTQASGSVKITYDKLSALQANVRIELIGQTQIGYKFKQEQYSATLDASSATALVDTVAKSIDAKLQIGKAVVTAPYHVVMEPFAPCGKVDEWGYCVADRKPALGGTMQATVAGLSLASKIVRGQKALVIQNAGLGAATSTLTHDGTLLASVDLNAALGRMFGATIGFVNKDQMAIAVTPGLDALVKIAASSVAQDFDLARWVRDETVTGKFSGSAAKVIANDEELQVVAGDMVLSSGVAGKGITATAGQCLAVKSKGVTGGGLLSLLVPVTCGGK